jgi:hypothetical protein
MKFPFFWNRDNPEKEFRRNVALTNEQADAQQQNDPAIENARTAERERLMLGDERVSKFLDQHPELASFIPALAPVNRTTKHISKRDAHIAWLDFQILFTLEEMCMSPDKYEGGGLEIMQGLEIYANTQISDGYEGWKGRILTENRKITTVNTGK